MKTKFTGLLFSIFFLLLSAVSLANSSKGYVLKGTLKGATNGTKIALVPFSKYSQKAELETVIKNGKFTFKGDVSEPRLYYLVLGDKNDYYQIMIENATITLKGEVAKKGEKDKFKNIVVSGSKSNDYFKSQVLFREKLNDLFESNQSRYKDIIILASKTKGEKNSKKMDSVMQLPAFKEYEKAEKDFFKTVESEFERVIQANKETFWGPLMMLSLYSYFTPDQRPTFEGMSKEAKESYYGEMASELLYPANKIGEKVHDFVTTDANGVKHSLAELIKGKKAVLIDFWASWCKPCRQELPNVKANYEKYASKGFEVISISIDSDPKAWQKALDDEKMKWPNFNDNEVATLYKVIAVPTTYLIDGEGKLIADNLRGEDLGKKLQELFGF